MARRLKAWVTNYDGRREAAVAATSKKEAARLIGASLYDFNNYAVEVLDEPDLRAMLAAQPGVVFLRAFCGFDEGQAWKARSAEPGEGGE